jgi:cation diffusion facilitator family transporter
LILVANGRHVLTDCWTSLAVLIGLGLVWVTGWRPFDPLCGLAMALNIFWSGTRLMRSAFAGLMDTADPEVQRALTTLLDQAGATHRISYHQLRHRNLGDAHWVEVHLLFPEGVSLREAHRVATVIEGTIEASLKPRAYVTSHLESASDHAVLHPEEMLRGRVASEPAETIRR